MNITKHYLHLPEVSLCYHLYEKPDEPDRTLLLLHGAGVAGQLTWHHVCRMSQGYRRMIVPDLRGAGETIHPYVNEKAFSIENIRADLVALLKHLQINELDIAGYSFGGACALDLNAFAGLEVQRLVLVEPALLERANFYQTLAIRTQYSEATRVMRCEDTSAEGVRQFAQLVMAVATKNPKTRETMYQRLAHRIIGLANELDALTAYMKSCDRELLYPNHQQVILIHGANSHQEMRQFHSVLATERAWKLVSVPGSDHSLIFQKPRKVAEAVSDILG
ncbi:alpha/beta fold hydrolase [Gynuella sunshinyii]|uniref:Putative hydrolase or acyltransferase (Alpha/beta hydrolase superfamily) n=1 Tax=Gynuella sunshinyii YC6258 TaxID=1445510 RepID=A0A0C5VNE6_9GAMM|nr:alpha/beta hydrolase [Gynuella sunshinyii]AJQ95826.1 putative hydrolase or acyltransferase (alpha/beta hydrolase superfamily) [Gynuella sunshinyii YC6258]